MKKNKHIIISCEGGDFSMDLIFAGLVRRFGKENIIDYPPRDKHRQGKPSLIGDDEKDYGAERRSLCYVDDCEDLKKYTQQEIIKLINKNEIDTIFVDETSSSAKIFYSLIKYSNFSPKVVIIAGHDHYRSGHPKSLNNVYHDVDTSIFIDDWEGSYDEVPNTHLINLSCNFDHLWDVKKRDEYIRNKVYDICFIGYNSNPVRKIVIDHIREKWGHLNNCIIFEERQDQFDKFIRHNEMFKLMAQSKVCLNLPGASVGGRALRYYEIPYVGSYMLSLKINAKLLKPDMGGTFETLGELDDLIEHLLDSTKKAVLNIRAYLDHFDCIDYHSIDARMNYIFKIIN